jgi:hypothetical protein
VVSFAVADSLAVIVQEDGVPKPGATVTWSAIGTAASVAPLTSVTDANGRAATKWTLGTVAGAQTARATLSGATGSPVSFTATATPAPLAAITALSGGDQTAAVNTPFANPLTVRVADQFGNVIAGATINWAVQLGSITLTGGAASLSNAAGVATKSIVAGATIGSAQVRATPNGIAINSDFDLDVIEASVGVTFGSNFFTSDKNGTSDPAVDTVVVGHTVLWTGAGGVHTVQSKGSPSFTNSGNLSGVGATYAVTFNATGTYQYDCGIHGPEMTGRIVVIP